MTRLNTARAFLNAGSFTAARKAVDEALNQDPEDNAAWQLRAHIEMTCGKYQAALDILRSRLATTPERVQMRHDEIICLIELKRREEANTAITAFRRDFPYLDTEGLVLECMLELMGGDLEIANTLFHDLQGRDVSSSTLRQLELILRTRVGDRFGRVGVCLDWVREEPDNPDAHEWLSFSRFELMEYAAARRSAKDVLRLDPSGRLPHALKLLSTIVWFPPFFIHEASRYLSTFLAGIVGRKWMSSINTVASVFLALLMFRIFGVVFKSAFVSIILLAGIFSWPMVKLMILKSHSASSPMPSVSLKNDY